MEKNNVIGRKEKMKDKRIVNETASVGTYKIIFMNAPS